MATIYEHDPICRNVLYTAVQAGHLNDVKTLVSKGFPITSDCFNWAITYGHLEMVQFLHSHGARITGESIGSAANGHLEILKYLCENGGLAYADDNYPIKIAAKKGYLEIVKYLHSQGADATADDEPLMLAGRAGHSEVVHFISACYNNEVKMIPLL